MAEIRMSLYQKPNERIKSIMDINDMISKSKELEKWNIDLKLNPDQLDAKVLKLPTIYDPLSKNERTVDQQLLGSLVHEPMGFMKWGIFCLNKDLDMAKHI